MPGIWKDLEGPGRQREAGLKPLRSYLPCGLGFLGVASVCILGVEGKCGWQESSATKSGRRSPPLSRTSNPRCPWGPSRSLDNTLIQDQGLPNSIGGGVSPAEGICGVTPNQRNPDEGCRWCRGLSHSHRKTLQHLLVDVLS